jgi:hypothetical protein
MCSGSPYESNSEFYSSIYHPDPTLYIDIETFTVGLFTYKNKFAGCNTNTFRCSLKVYHLMKITMKNNPILMLKYLMWTKNNQ